MTERCVDRHLGRPQCSRTPAVLSPGFGTALCDHCYIWRAAWVEARVTTTRALPDAELGAEWRKLRGWARLGRPVLGHGDGDGWEAHWQNCSGCDVRFLRGRKGWERCITCTKRIELARLGKAS